MTNHRVQLHWDGKHCLWLGRRPIAHFRRLAPSQMSILAALEARGWPPEPIPNPLPRETWETDADYGDRLSYTVKNLNKRVRGSGIRFGDDRVNVWWERVPPDRTGGKGPD